MVKWLVVTMMGYAFILLHWLFVTHEIFCNPLSLFYFQCEIEWFHFQCVNLTSKPKGKWWVELSWMYLYADVKCNVSMKCESFLILFFAGIVQNAVKKDVERTIRMKNRTNQINRILSLHNAFLSWTIALQCVHSLNIYK